MLFNSQFVMMLLRVLFQRVKLQVRKWSMAAGRGCSDQIADEELLFKHEILSLTECCAGCELPFFSNPGFCSLPFTKAAVDPETPLGQSRGHRGSWAVLLPHANHQPTSCHARARAN